MIELGYKYITIFKKTFFHPFITLKPAYKQLSLDRQAYSNKVLDLVNEEKDVDVCNRCKDEINENDEIHYPNDKAVCEYCIESKECDKLYNN